MPSTTEVLPAEVKSNARKRVIISAVVQLLKEGGGGALTTDAIAARAKTSKATIYRYWPDKTQLLIEAADRIIRAPEIPDLGSFRKEVTLLLSERLTEYQGEGVHKMFAALIGISAEDPVFDDHLRKWMELRLMATNKAIVRRAKERGEIHETVSSEAAATLVAAPLMFRMVLQELPLDEAFLNSVIDCLVFGLSKGSSKSL